MIASIFAKVIPRFSCEALKFCNIITRALHSPQRTCNSIFANTFLQTGNVLVEGIQQGLILAAESQIGVLCKQSVASAERRTISAVTKASRSERCW